jgi:probable HAF family extracellular repeat protein
MYMNNPNVKNLNRRMSGITLVMQFLLLGALSYPVMAQASYTVTDIGPLNDINDQAPGAACVNNAGVVVGQALLPTGPDRPFVWITGNIFDLGTFGGPNGGARGINARGEVVGKADTAAVPEQEHAFLWSGGVLHDLGTFGGDSSVANSINNRGWTVGAADTTIPDPTGTIGPTENHAFLRTLRGELHDLGTLGGPNSHAISINDNGVIVGWSQVDFTVGSFGIPDLHPAMWANGVLTRLADLGGSVSLALSVNNNGTAVGQSFVADDSAFYAVMWQKGELSNLGAVGDDVASAAGSINSLGDAVGYSITTSFASRAFLWRKGVMTDLNTLIPANSGWVLQSAGHINDAGQIVGFGVLNGNLHAFLLTPVPGGDRTGSATTPPAPVQLSDTMRRSLAWEKSRFLKHGSTWIK